MQQTTEFEWPPLEGNPEIFADYMHKLGLPASWGFGEIYGFDEELLCMVPQPCVAVIANVERLKKAEDKEKGDEACQSEFYMKQTNVLDNACGVIACLHSIYNNKSHITLEEGVLKNYLS